MDVNNVGNELGSKTYYKILISIKVIVYVIYHLEGHIFFILKLSLQGLTIFSFIVYIGLVNAFYFHKYPYIFKLIKLN